MDISKKILFVISLKIFAMLERNKMLEISSNSCDWKISIFCEIFFNFFKEAKRSKHIHMINLFSHLMEILRYFSAIESKDLPNFFKSIFNLGNVFQFSPVINLPCCHVTVQLFWRLLNVNKESIYKYFNFPPPGIEWLV